MAAVTGTAGQGAANPMMQQMQMQQVALANAQQMERVRGISMIGFEWFKRFVGSLRHLVERVFARLGLRGRVSATPAAGNGQEARPGQQPGRNPANFLNDAPAGAGSPAAVQNEAESPDADEERFAAPEGVQDTSTAQEAVQLDPATNALANNLAMPDMAPVVTFECLPEQLEAVRDELMASLKPLFENPLMVVEETWPSAKISIAAEALGEQCERMRYAHRITSREIMRLAKDAITRNPKAYAGLSAASLVESLRQHTGARTFSEESFESRILQQIEVQKTIKEGYEAYITNALGIMDAATTPNDRRAIKQVMMSAATDTRVSLEQLEERLLASASPQARERFSDVNMPSSAGFDLPVFTKTLMAMDEPGYQRPAAPAAAAAPAIAVTPAPAAVAVPGNVVSQAAGTSKHTIAPGAEQYLNSFPVPRPAQDEALNKKVVETISAVASAPPRAEPALKVVSSTPFPATPVANPVAAALARSKPAAAETTPAVVENAPLPSLSAAAPSTVVDTAAKYAALLSDEDGESGDAEGMVS